MSNGIITRSKYIYSLYIEVSCAHACHVNQGRAIDRVLATTSTHSALVSGKQPHAHNHIYIILTVDEMGNRIDDLEKSIGDLMTQVRSY